MSFKNYSDKIYQQFDKMSKNNELFISSVNGNELWDLYLKSFKTEDDPVFRDPQSSTHNCNSDKSFIKRYGNIVSIDKNGNIETIFDIKLDKNSPYYNSNNNLKKLLKKSEIKTVFFETYNSLTKLNYGKVNKNQTVFRLGIEENFKKYTKEEVQKFGVVEEGRVYKFNHFYIDLPKKFVDFTGKSTEAIQGFYNDKYQVFKRCLEEISIDTLLLVKDLINQGSLLDGNTHLHSIEEMIKIYKDYNKTKIDKKNFCWINTYSLDERLAKFKNTLIGVLCTELAEGENINKACQNWNKRVDPVNYMKAKSPITQKQIEEAKKFIQENGYEESFNRRFAVLDDIKVTEILHSNIGDGSIKKVSIFDNVKPSGAGRHKKNQFDNLEKVTIDKFMKDILPTCTSIEAFFENRMQGNLVALTTSDSDNSKPIFKWGNNFSWTFNGNLAGKSQIKDAVKSRGGQTEADVRLSMHFPDTTSDYDLHLIEPNGTHIFYSNRRTLSKYGGMLDLDAQGCDGHQPPEKRVENIVYTSKSKMVDGDYKIYVHNYSGGGVNTSFNFEIEIEGSLTTLKSKKGLRGDCEIGHLNCQDGRITFKPNNKHIEIVESQELSKQVWSINTNEFHKVNLVCSSPNHWGENSVGNLHYMFMLDNCKSDVNLSSFHNENLIPDLLKHRKVMEVLSSTNMLEPADKQLCGLGFNSTVKDELILKLNGTFKRTVKVVF